MLSLTEAATTVKVSGPEDELQKVSNELSFRPENYWRAESYQVYESTAGKHGWDGYIYPLRIIKGTGIIARGLIWKLISTAEKLHVQVDTSGRLRNPFGNLVVDDVADDLLVGLVLDQNQRACIADWLSCGMGVHNVTVGGGKTATFAGACAVLKARFPEAHILYITHTERLVRQVFKELRQFLPKLDISQYGGGVKDNSGKDVVVATSACILRNFNTLRFSWLKKFMAVLVDESHHASSPSYEKILASIPAYFRLGASDSVKADDVSASTKIEGALGPVRLKIEPYELIRKGRLAKPHIYLVDVPDWKDRFKHCSHSAETETHAWVLLDGEWKKGVYLGPVYEVDAEAEDGIKKDRHGDPVQIQSLHRISIDGHELEISSRWCLLDRTYDRAIIRFKDRNDLIAEWVEYYSNQGWPTLVVATRTLHILILEATIKKRIGSDKVKILFSENSSAERDATFEWLKKSVGGVLITPLVKEGVSINELKAGVIADPVASWEYAKQLIGRFLRKKVSGEENEAHITWFIDRQHTNFRRGCYAVFDKLEKIRGFTYYYPVVHPSDVKPELRFSAAEKG